jgi:hypothetical protein
MAPPQYASAYGDPMYGNPLYGAQYAQAAPGWNQMPPGYAPPPPSAAAGAAAMPPGFSAAMGEIADKNGLGMFKDFLNLDDGEFWKGALVGAAIVLLMTNEELRNSLIGGATKTAEAVKSGLAGFGGGSATSDDGEETSDEETNEEIEK